MQKTILAVDDSPTVREVLQTTLLEAGYNVLTAADGQEALSKIDAFNVDMVVTDLNMPNLDGIHLISEVRNRPGYRFKPIMMLTSETQPEVRKAGKLAGASCWINKPFKPKQLLSVVKMVLPA